MTDDYPNRVQRKDPRTVKQYITQHRGKGWCWGILAREAFCAPLYTLLFAETVNLLSVSILARHMAQASIALSYIAHHHIRMHHIVTCNY